MFSSRTVAGTRSRAPSARRTPRTSDQLTPLLPEIRWRFLANAGDRRFAGGVGSGRARFNHTVGAPPSSSTAGAATFDSFARLTTQWRVSFFAGAAASCSSGASTYDSGSFAAGAAADASGADGQPARTQGMRPRRMPARSLRQLRRRRGRLTSSAGTSEACSAGSRRLGCLRGAAAGSGSGIASGAASSCHHVGADGVVLAGDLHQRRAARGIECFGDHVASRRGERRSGEEDDDETHARRKLVCAVRTPFRGLLVGVVLHGQWRRLPFPIRIRPVVPASLTADSAQKCDGPADQNEEHDSDNQLPKSVVVSISVSLP